DRRDDQAQRRRHGGDGAGEGAVRRRGRGPGHRGRIAAPEGGPLRRGPARRAVRDPMRRTLRAASAAAALLVFVVFLPARAAAQTIDFEDLPPGTAVKAQYGARGVIFPGDAHIATDSHAHSGSRVLRSIAETAEVFTVSPLVMTFTSPQKRVAF